MKARYPIPLVARFAMALAFAIPFGNLTAAEAEKSTAYTLQCDMVPVEDIIIQSGEGFKIVGANSQDWQDFELHALVSWSMPKLGDRGRKLNFSGAILSVYLIKSDVAAKNRHEDPPSAPDPEGKTIAHRYSWTPARPVQVVTTISLNDPQSSETTTQSDGVSTDAGGGFTLKTMADYDGRNHSFKFSVTFEGRFTLDGVQYETNGGPFGGGKSIYFNAKVQPDR